MRFCLLILLAVACSSCARYTYVLNSPQVSLFESKKEIKVGGGLAFQGAEGQLGYSITDKFAFQANGFFGGRSQAYGEALFGYYKRIEDIHLETFVGAGLCNLDYKVPNAEYNDITINVDCRYFKIPLQQTVAMHFGNHGSFFITGRYSFIHYNSYSFQYVDTDNPPHSSIGYHIKSSDSAYAENVNGHLLDLFMGLRFGVFRVEAGTSFKSNFGILHDSYNMSAAITHPSYFPLRITAGFLFTIGKNKSLGGARAEYWGKDNATDYKPSRSNGEDIR